MYSNEFHIMGRYVVLFNIFYNFLNETLFNHQGISLYFFFPNVFHLTTYDLLNLKFALQTNYVTMNFIVFHMFFFSILCFVYVGFWFSKQRFFFCCDLCLLALFMFCWNITQMLLVFHVFFSSSFAFSWYM